MKKFGVILVYCILTLGTLLVFWQVRNFDFINYDDPDYVSENPHVLNGLTVDGIIWAFTSGHASNWHPLTWLSLMLDCQLFGANPGALHFINLLIHIANALLLFAVFKKMTGALWQSAFVAAVFAIHPMHVESVAWIAERKDLLSTMFLLLTLAAYISFVRHRDLSRYLVTILLFASGLLAKPMLVTLPFLLLLLDYWPLNRFDQVIKKSPQKKLPFTNRASVLIMIEKIPFFVLAAGLSIVTFLVQRTGGAVKGLPVQIRIENASLSYIKYIEKMFWPKNMAVFYPYEDRILLWQVAVCALLLVSISIFVIYLGRKHKYLPVGWFWFLGTLVPVIGFVQVGDQSMADRYTYIPYIGLFIMIAWGISKLLSEFRNLKIMLSSAVMIALAAMTIVTYRQVGYWKDSFSVFSHAVTVTKNNYIAHDHLGRGYNSIGRYNDAVNSCMIAIKINPKYAEAHNNLGIAYGGLGLYQEEMESFKQAIRIKPDYVQAIGNLGAAYSLLGHNQEAIESSQQALRIKPDYAEAHYNLGVIYAKTGQMQDAAQSFKDAIKINPGYVQAHYNLGIVYSSLGQVTNAIESFKQAIRIKPDYDKAHFNLGLEYLKYGKKDLALEEYKILQNLNSELAKNLFAPDANGPVNQK